MIGGAAADKEPVVHVADDRPSFDPARPDAPLSTAPHPEGSDSAVPGAGPLQGNAAKWTKKQKAAAAVITADAPCHPVLVRAVITGPARMPRAALDILTPQGQPIGHVALANTSDAFDLQQRFWLVGQPEQGAVVALVSEGATQVILPGGRLREGPATAQDFSPVACRLLGWERAHRSEGASGDWQAVLTDQRAAVGNERFTKAVDRFRLAAVFIPMVFFAFCFPFLFVIPWAVEAGYSMPGLLALPVLGGGLMTAWSYHCRRQLVAEAELIEAGATEHGKAIAFTQSYWASMRKPAKPWEGPVPDAIR